MTEKKKSEARDTNKNFAHTNLPFREACRKAGVIATKRQASKFRRGQGKAWRVTHPA